MPNMHGTGIDEQLWAVSKYKAAAWRAVRCYVDHDLVEGVEFKSHVEQYLSDEESSFKCAQDLEEDLDRMVIEPDLRDKCPWNS